MLLNEIFEKYGRADLNFLKPNNYTYAVSFEFWREQLFERCMRLFTYEGLPESLPRKELEQRFIVQGYNIVTDKADGLVRAFYGHLTNFTGIYFDEPLEVCTMSPRWSKTLKVDEECVLIDNTSTRNSLYPLIYHYSVLLAHASVSLQNVLVNGRDANGVPVAKTQQQANAIKTYLNNLWNGKRSSVLDKQMLGVDFMGAHGTQALSVKDCVETINNLLDDFYNSIGVKTSKDKKGNMLTPEIEADNPMLLLNINDMLDARKKGVEKINAMYGTNITVEISEELRTMNEDDFDVESEGVKDNEIV